MALIAVIAVIVAVVVGTGGFFEGAGPAKAPLVSAPTRVGPSPSPTPSSTSPPEPSSTPAPAPSSTPPPEASSTPAAGPAPAPRFTYPPGAEADPLSRSEPVRLQIAAIGVSSELMDLGLRADGTMAVPPGGFPAGWYTGGPTPGEQGPAVIAGHVDMNGPGVFYNLHKVRPGDSVTVTRKDGSKPVFRVSRVVQYPKDEFPTKLVYGNTRQSVLRLITCGGSFNSRTGHYEDNIVAYANLVATGR